MDISSSPNHSRRDAAAEAASISGAGPVATAGRALPRENSVDCSACRVLVVEDDPAVLETCVRILRRAAYSVSSAADGEGGWTALQRGNFQLLFTDNRMPRLTGIELIHRLRAEGLTLPVILASGTVPWDLAVIPPEFLPLTVLKKPYGRDALLASIYVALCNDAALPLHASAVTAHA